MKIKMVLLCAVFFFPIHMYSAEAGGLVGLFNTRNQAADVYNLSKRNMSDKLQAILSFGSAWGVYKYLCATRKAGKLGAFIEAASLGMTVFRVADIMHKFALNPLVRLCPSVAKKRREKTTLTKSLFTFLDSHNIATVLQLPSVEHVHGKTAAKMHAKLCSTIKYGGLETDTGWVDKLIVRQRPAYAGSIPELLVLRSQYINNPERFLAHGAMLDKGLLILGPPGTGKSTLAEVLAYEAQCPFIAISPASFVNKYVGTGANNLKGIVEMAEGAALAFHRKRMQRQEQEHRQRLGTLARMWCAIKRVIWRNHQQEVPMVDEYIKPTILCLDEIDAIAAKRRSDAQDHPEDRRTEDELLNLIKPGKSHVFFVGTSNERAAYFDEALIRPGRMGVPIQLGLPDRASRFEIIKLYAQKLPKLLPILRVPPQVHFQDIAGRELLAGRARRRARHFDFWHGLVECTHGFSGDELRKLFNDAAMLAGAQDAQWLCRVHIEQALHSMIETMPEERQHRYRQENYEQLPRHVQDRPGRACDAQEAAQMVGGDEACQGDELPDGVFA